MKTCLSPYLFAYTEQNFKIRMDGKPWYLQGKKTRNSWATLQRTRRKIAWHLSAYLSCIRNLLYNLCIGHSNCNLQAGGRKTGSARYKSERTISLFRNHTVRLFGTAFVCVALFFLPACRTLISARARMCKKLETSRLRISVLRNYCLYQRLLLRQKKIISAGDLAAC